MEQKVKTISVTQSKAGVANAFPVVERKGELMSQKKEHLFVPKDIESMRMLDDALMNAVFNNDTETTAAILKIILQKPDLQVTRVEAQSIVSNGEKRSARFDISAVDSEMVYYDIEVQRSNSGATPKRARFNAAMMDKKMLDTNQNWKLLPKLYIIFITEHDVLKGEKPIYHIKRTISEMHERCFEDDEEIIYINCAFNGKYKDKALLDLIHDFRCEDPAEMRIPELARKVLYVKNDEEGKKSMSEYIQRVYADDIRAAREIEHKITFLERTKQFLLFTKEDYPDSVAYKKMSSRTGFSIAFLKRLEECDDLEELIDSAEVEKCVH